MVFFAFADLAGWKGSAECVREEAAVCCSNCSLSRGICRFDQTYYQSVRTGNTQVIARLECYQKLQERDLFWGIIQPGADLRFRWLRKRQLSRQRRICLFKKEGDLMYTRFFKRALDFILSGAALIVLLPILLILTVAGAIAMGGNPFFTQHRPGKIDPRTGEERIFRLVKFRTMSNKKGKDGKLLPDEVRLNKYGRFLRSTSLDELPELWNIFIGDMSVVGPRPLLVEYLEYYTPEERRRHMIRPGLTGWAQVNGRNAISWDQKLAYDVEYISEITLKKDIVILFMTVQKVFKRSDIQVGAEFKAGKFIDQRKNGVRNAILEEKGIAKGA